MTKVQPQFGNKTTPKGELMFVQILFAILSTQTIKTLIGEGLQYLLNKTDTEIDNKLADVVVEAVVASKGNPYTLTDLVKVV